MHFTIDVSPSRFRGEGQQCLPNPCDKKDLSVLPLAPPRGPQGQHGQHPVLSSYPFATPGFSSAACGRSGRLEHAMTEDVHDRGRSAATEAEVNACLSPSPIIKESARPGHVPARERPTPARHPPLRAGVGGPEGNSRNGSADAGAATVPPGRLWHGLLVSGRGCAVTGGRTVAASEMGYRRRARSRARRPPRAARTSRSRVRPRRSPRPGRGPPRPG